MQLKLKRNRATFLELREANPEEIEQEDFDLRHRTIFDEHQTDSFSVEFRLGVTVDKSYRLTVQYTSQFETDSEIGADFRDSSFVRINAPAIAFPFIRSYVAHITLIGGFESVILPSVNFTVKDSDIKPFDAD